MAIQMIRCKIHPQCDRRTERRNGLELEGTDLDRLHIHRLTRRHHV
jgi:hypothetical protein